jgi:hypothetical protein
MLQRKVLVISKEDNRLCAISLTDVCRNSWIHDLLVARLSALNVHVNGERLEDQQELGIVLTSLQLDNTPCINSRVHEEIVELIIGMHQS